MGRLAEEAAYLSVQLAHTTTALAVCAPFAWLEAWSCGVRQVSATAGQQIERQARTDRLVRRGIPREIAGRELRVV